MHGTYSMMEPCVMRSGVNQLCQPKLFDPPESLKNGMLNDVKNQITFYSDETIDRIIKYFLFIQSIAFFFRYSRNKIDFIQPKTGRCKDIIFYGRMMK